MKAGEFDPSKFDDRYDAALAQLVQAKINGKKIVPLRPPKPTKPNDLLEALRLSAGIKGDTKTKGAAGSRKSSSRAASKPKAKATPARRTAPVRRKAS